MRYQWNFLRLGECKNFFFPSLMTWTPRTKNLRLKCFSLGWFRSSRTKAADANNYRGIALMSLCAKLRNKMLLQRIRPRLDPLFRPNQNGFRPRRGTTQHVLALRRVFEQCRLKQKTNCVAMFIDYSKAFDSISRGIMKKNHPFCLRDTREGCRHDHAPLQRIKSSCHDYRWS